jgi:TetR/AcrR family transcriptional regulator, multidrug resistance operon repressor
MNVHSVIFVTMRARDECKMDAIQKATIEIVVNHGLDGLSMGKLAKVANVSPATIYIYYKDREDLIVGICTRLNNNLLAASLKDFDPDMDFGQGLKVQWKNRAAHFLSHPMETQFVEHIRYTPLYEKVRNCSNINFKDIMCRFLNNAIEKKQLVKLPFEVYWSVAFAPLYQLIKFHAQGKSYVNDKFELNEEIMDQALELVLKALKP